MTARLLLCVLFAGGCRTASEPTLDPMPSAEPVEKDRKAPDAVSVHGHWKVEVKQPDGTVVRTLEVENAFVDSAGVVPKLLAGHVSYGAWQIDLRASTGTKPCVFDGERDCITTNNRAYAELEGWRYRTLEVASDGYAVTLHGSVTTASTSAIDKLESSLYWCEPTINQYACNIQNPTDVGLFSTRTLTGGDVVAVEAGHIVVVDVTFTFGNG